jgi:hypothetical protein
LALGHKPYPDRPVQPVLAFMSRDTVRARIQEGLPMIAERFLATVSLVALCAAPALARPTVIAELGSAPLLGTSTSTAEMRARVARNEGIVSAAAVRLGLTAGEYAQFHAAIDESRVAWVTVPRHLDSMTWQAGGRVYALHDVIIPSGTHGWEVDVPSHGGVLALYMPAKCGNLSLVRRPVRAIAQHTIVPAHVAVVASPAPVPPPPVVVAAAPAPPDDAPAPAAPAPPSEFPPAPAAAAKHNALFLAPLLFGLAALSGGSGSGPIAAPPVGCP